MTSASPFCGSRAPESTDRRSHRSAGHVTSAGRVTSPADYVGGRLSFREPGLVEDPALGEVCPDHLVPTAQRVLDGDQAHRRELRRIALRDGWITDAIKVFREYFLAGI